MAWGAVLSISCAGEVAIASRPWEEVVWASLLNGVPLVGSTWVVALNRRRLLRPEWSSRRTMLVHAGVGLVFAVTLSLMMLGLMRITGRVNSEIESLSGWGLFLFGVMYGVFIYMVFAAALMWSESMRRVRESQAEVAEAAVLRAEAEAKAVRAQFNPHFVFNTLHSLMLLVRADPAAAERAIEDVATLIRYASIVQRRDLDVVPVSKECEVARRYVALEHLRLGHRLRTEWEVEEGVSDLVLPAFALQTLVENAVKHGIEPVPEGGTIRIGLRRSDGRLVVSVEDDGAGCDPEGILRPGHGLELLQRRLASRSGEAASLTWDGNTGNGFRVTMAIPAEAAESDPELAVISERGGPELAGASAERNDGER